MRHLTTILAGIAALAVAAPVTAQPADWWAPRGPTYERYHDRQGNGPPFCRNGQGHPVHGMAWCEQKGWARVFWDDVVFRGPDRRSEQPYVSEPSLVGILGDVVLGRLATRVSNLGLDGEMQGRWVPMDDGPTVLQLRVGDSPLAEFTDMDRDGRADIVLMIDPR